MKITKRQLRQIIKEEKQKLVELGISRGEEASYELYVNLSDDQLEALDDLTATLERCRRLGIPEADIADTIRAGGF